MEDRWAAGGLSNVSGSAKMSIEKLTFDIKS